MCLLFAIPADGGVTISPDNPHKPYSLSGKAVSVHGRGIVGARVIILGKSNMKQAKNRSVSDGSGSKTIVADVRTDDNGKFEIEFNSSGTYTVKVKAGGFKTWNQQVVVNGDKNITVTLKSSQ